MTPQTQWYNCELYKVSYKRLYKCGSQSVLDMLTNWVKEDQPKYEKRFSVVREPVERAKSIYKEMVKRHTPNPNNGWTMGCESFSEWLQYLVDNGFYNNHQYTQMDLLENSSPIRLFTLSEMKNVTAWIGSDTNRIRTVNVNKQKVKVTDTDLDLIARLYGVDFDLFNLVKSNQKKDGFLCKSLVDILG